MNNNPLCIPYPLSEHAPFIFLINGWAPIRIWFVFQMSSHSDMKSGCFDVSHLADYQIDKKSIGIQIKHNPDSEQSQFMRRITLLGEFQNSL